MALPVVAILHADSLHYSQTLVFPRYFLFVYINNNTRVIISLRKTNVFYHKSQLLLVDLPHIIYSHSRQPVNTFPLWDDPKADLIFKTIFKDFHVISLFCKLTRQVRRFLYLSDQDIGDWLWSFIIFFIFALKTLQKPFAIRNISVTLPLVIAATVVCKLLKFRMLK